MFKRFASMILALIMVIGVFPVSAMAEDATLTDRAYLNLGEFGVFFERGVSNFRSNGIEGKHIRYTYNVSDDETAEDVLETLSENANNQFLGWIESPDPEVYTKVERIDMNWEDRTSEFLDENGNFDGGLTWFKYFEDGNLQNVSKTFSITWTSEDGTQKQTDNIQISLIFPQIPDPAADRTVLVMPENIQEYFDIGTNREGDYLEYYWNEPDATIESIETILADFQDDGFMARIEAPNAMFNKVKSIGWWGEDKTHYFTDENGEIVFNGDLASVFVLDSNGNLFNDSIDFRVAWTDSAGTKEYVDEITIAIVFPQLEQNPGDGDDGEIKPTCLRADVDDSRIYGNNGDSNLFSQERNSFDGSVFKGKVTFNYNGNEENPEDILAKLTANGEGSYFIPSLAAPSKEFNIVKTVLRNGSEVDFNNISINNTDIGKIIEFMPLNFADENGLCSTIDEYTVVWETENGEEHTDVIRFRVVFFGEGPDEPPRGPSTNSGENDYPDAVEIEVDGAVDGITYSYDPETGVAEFVIAENDAEDWQNAYIEAGLQGRSIGAVVITEAPEWAVAFSGENGGDNFLEEFIGRVESEGHEFDPVRDGDPYYRSYIELAHITRNETTGKVTISLTEENTWTHFAWVDENGNIVYQSVNLIGSVAEGTTEILTFDDAFADIRTISPEDFNNRIEINEITSNQMTEEDSEGNLNYKDGVLTLTYIGEGTDYESVTESFIDELGSESCGEANMTVYSPEAGYKAYKMEFGSGWHKPGEDAETLPLWAMFYDGEKVNTDEEYYLYWISEDGTNFIIERIGISFKFPFKNIWMEKYWEPLSYGEEDSRLKITVGASHSTAVEYSLEELEENGAILTVEEGHITVSFDENNDLFVITNLIAQVEPPEGAVYYRRNNSTAPNVLDYENAEDQNEIIMSGDIRTVEEDGKPRMDLSGFEVFEVNGLEVYISYVTGMTRVQIIDWYDENDEIIQRDYFYVNTDDFCVTQVAESVESLSAPVEKPTPVGEESWILTTNHFAQGKSDSDVNAYYFQLEGDENTPDGDKVIYLPYSFIEEGLDYEKALAMKIEPKIYHYNEDHETLVEGAPIDGELTPYGIRFVVKSFSPFVLEWEIEEQVIHEFGETTYEWSEDGKICTAKRVCANCEEHYETAEAEVTSEKETDATCTEKGKTKYTAAFEEAWAEPQTKTVDDIGVLGHKWDEWVVVKEPTYTEDGVEKRVCKNDATHVETKAVAKLVPDTTEKVEGPDSSKEYVVAYLEDTVIVPEGLEEKYPTQEDVKKALAEEAKLEGQIIFREVTVGYYDEDGNFVPVENEEFFKDGKTIDIVLEYPEGATKEDDFEILHLKGDGTIEKCTIKAKTDKGIVVEVNSLSPFAIIFEKYVEEEEKDSWLDWFDWLGKLDRPSKNDKPNPGVTIITPSEKEEETNPNTGAPIFDMTLAGTIVLAASVIFIGKKR